MNFEKGERVRVPDPQDRGKTVAAIFVTPTEAGPSPEFAWVRYLEGSKANTLGRVACAEITKGLTSASRSARALGVPSTFGGLCPVLAP